MPYVTRSKKNSSASGNYHPSNSIAMEVMAPSNNMDKDIEVVLPPEKSLRNMILIELWNKIDNQIIASEGSSYGVNTAMLKTHKKSVHNMLNYVRANQTKKQMLPPTQLKSLSIISPTSDITGATTNSD
jgi:hypothetical protein